MEATLKKIIAFKNLRTQLIVTMLIVAIIPLTIAGVSIYCQRVRSIKEEGFSKLQAIRDLKVREVNNWLNERVADISVLSTENRIQQMTVEIAKGTGGAGAETSLRYVHELFSEYVKEYGSTRKFLLSEGKQDELLPQQTKHILAKIARTMCVFLNRCGNKNSLSETFTSRRPLAGHPWLSLLRYSLRIQKVSSRQIGRVRLRAS